MTSSFAAAGCGAACWAARKAGPRRASSTACARRPQRGRVEVSMGLGAARGWSGHASQHARAGVVSVRKNAGQHWCASDLAARRARRNPPARVMSPRATRASPSKSRDRRTSLGKRLRDSPPTAPATIPARRSPPWPISAGFVLRRPFVHYRRALRLLPTPLKSPREKIRDDPFRTVHAGRRRCVPRVAPPDAIRLRCRT